MPQTPQAGEGTDSLPAWGSLCLPAGLPGSARGRQVNESAHRPDEEETKIILFCLSLIVF